MNSETPQQLPGSGPERELLREKGQFWTPDWVADAMLAYVAQNDTDHVFDPAVGAGAFFRATHRLCAETGRQLQLLGTEIDREALGEAVATGLSDADLKNVRIANFLLDPPTRLFKAIVGNPPYIRHHRLPSEYKIELKKLGEGTIGTPIDGRAGLHVYFLIRALTLLEPGGRLAFIMPADTCEGIFAKSLWRWITKNYALNAVITFDRFAAPFPKVDVNAIIFLIAKGKQPDHFKWVECKRSSTLELKRWIFSGFVDEYLPDLGVHQRSILEALDTGLSRPPRKKPSGEVTLLNFAKVVRGIATGANDYFLLTKQQANDLDIPDEFLKIAIGRTRDLEGRSSHPILSKISKKRAGQHGYSVPTDAAWMNSPPRLKIISSKAKGWGYPVLL